MNDGYIPAKRIEYLTNCPICDTPLKVLGGPQDPLMQIDSCKKCGVNVDSRVYIYACSECGVETTQLSDDSGLPYCRAHMPLNEETNNATND